MKQMSETDNKTVYKAGISEEINKKAKSPIKRLISGAVCAAIVIISVFVLYKINYNSILSTQAKASADSENSIINQNSSISSQPDDSTLLTEADSKMLSSTSAEESKSTSVFSKSESPVSEAGLQVPAEQKEESQAEVSGVTSKITLYNYGRTGPQSETDTYSEESDAYEAHFIVWNGCIYMPRGVSVPDSDVGSKLNGDSEYYQYKKASANNSIVFRIANHNLLYNVSMSGDFDFNGYTYEIIDYYHKDSLSHKQGNYIGEYNDRPVYNDTENDNYVYIYLNMESDSSLNGLGSPYLAKIIAD